jgi:NADPH-dependent curcumin reductase CurA
VDAGSVRCVSNTHWLKATIVFTASPYSHAEPTAAQNIQAEKTVKKSWNSAHANKQIAEWVANELGIDEYFDEVLPQDKVAKVKEVQSPSLAVSMVATASTTHRPSRKPTSG